MTQETMKKYRIHIGIIAFFVVILIGIVYGSVYMLHAIMEKSRAVEKKEIDYSIESGFLENVQESQKNVTYIEQGDALLHVLLPNTDDAKVQLFYELEAIAKEANILQIQFDIAQDDKKKKRKKKKDEDGEKEKEKNVLNVNITMICTYNNLVYFMQKVENMQFFGKVVSFNIMEITRDTIAKTDEELAQKMSDNSVRAEIRVVFYLDNI